MVQGATQSPKAPSCILLDSEFVGSKESYIFWRRHANGHHMLVKVGLKLGAIVWRRNLAIGVDKLLHDVSLSWLNLINPRFDVDNGIKH